MRRSFVSVICGFAALSAFGDDSVITPVTTKDYVDNVISDKQPLSPITGVNKIMTYGATTGAQTGSRDIETTSIGTDTTADKIAAAGIIVAALNNKQNNVIGSNNWVMTGTNTAGNLGGKPIYSSTNNYSNALVTAETVNNAAIAAANSEFSCETYVEGAEQIPDNCLIWRIHTNGPTTLPVPRLSIGDPMINGTSRCNRGLDGSNNGNGRCNADTLAYLGAAGNKSGKWGVVFPYGEVAGKSVCSTDIGDVSLIQHAATDEQNAILDAEYAARLDFVDGGSNPFVYCWCKVEQPAVSKWVLHLRSTSYSQCTNACTESCSFYTRDGFHLRIPLFGSVDNN